MVGESRVVWELIYYANFHDNGGSECTKTKNWQVLLLMTNLISVLLRRCSSIVNCTYCRRQSIQWRLSQSSYKWCKEKLENVEGKRTFLFVYNKYIIVEISLTSSLSNKYEDVKNAIYKKIIFQLFCELFKTLNFHL